ncbi:flagellar basal body-associated FliL family protein [Phaeovulum vinaykumarii]|uniref:Flagellar protein FliL n=1 Tax=Phaeovulum vinaykumarii TaxID=407234 RepID=A0A1N7KB53_9RHOB|nr:flagellar basal body-associated FliL family protein [Phaeovulum vinaykumarii]SIS58740.1 flagellar FliL protein [Phaeovulum vinaykumarii]SOB93904.1 flagellar FliL protein [Phaeovulum vinaykumarii]
MAEENAEGEAAPEKKSKLPLILGVVLMLGLGGGGFFAVYSGMILGQGEDAAHAEAEDAVPVEPLPDIAFVPLEPLVVALGGNGGRHLRFNAQLEVAGPHEAEVARILPRVLDVINGYLQAVDVDELEARNALIKLRAQLLRRVQIVTGEGRVRDLLVTEFVIN